MKPEIKEKYDEKFKTLERLATTFCEFTEYKPERVIDGLDLVGNEYQEWAIAVCESIIVDIDACVLPPFNGMILANNTFIFNLIRDRQVWRDNRDFIDSFERNSAKYTPTKLDELRKEIQGKYEFYSSHVLELDRDNKIIAKMICRNLWDGWETDNTTYLVEIDGVDKIYTTSHGAPYECGPRFLEEQIQSYKNAIAGAEALLAAYRKDPTV